MKRIAIIGTAGIPARYGGFETLAQHLSNYLQYYHEVHVYCSTKLYSKQEQTSKTESIHLHYVPLDSNGWQSIPYDIISIFHALFYADVLVILGVSGCILLPFIKFFTKKKIVVNIDGLEWKRNKWNFLIKRYLKFSEKLAVKFSDADITDNQAIKDYTAEEYGSNSILIEYGADHVSKEIISNDDIKEYPFLSLPYAFNVCRIEPENNIHTILEAFSNTRKTLVMVGNWQHSTYGKVLIQQYSKYANIHLLDPIYDSKKLNLLRSNCEVYIHGHSAGGTNPSLVEAMYLGLPIIAFDVSYNRETTEHQALYFSQVCDLESKLNSLTDEICKNIASSMKEIAHRRYTWNQVAKKYNHLIYGFDFNYRRSSVVPKISILTLSELQQLNLRHIKMSSKLN